MRIVQGDAKYYPDVSTLITEFYNESLHEYDTRLDLDALNKTMTIHKDNAFLLIVEDKCVGLIAGLQVQSPINADKVYQEIIWYVKKEYRTKGVFLLKEVERMLRESGFTAIIMACVHNSKTEKLFKLYQRMGYVPIETHFRRSLCQ